MTATPVIGAPFTAAMVQMRTAMLPETSLEQGIALCFLRVTGEHRCHDAHIDELAAKFIAVLDRRAKHYRLAR